MSYLPQQRNSLEPAETFLDPLSFLLANAVAGMTRLPLVEGTAAAPTLILRYVGCDLHVAALSDEVGRVKAFVATQRYLALSYNAVRFRAFAETDL